ncbi:MAG: hypothetical protein IPJ85_14135 [Flavobacteriales bacterium]|nr:hypothetical protein [Flavobacteriales bacterium]
MLLYLAIAQLAFQVIIECHRSWSNTTVVGTALFKWLGRRKIVRRIEHAFSPFITRFKDENKNLLTNIENRWKQVPGYDFNLSLAKRLSTASSSSCPWSCSESSLGPFSPLISPSG